MVRIPGGMRKPTLVLSTDGVGTKVLVALQGRTVRRCWRGSRQPQRQRHPRSRCAAIAFMDYIAGSGLDVEQIAGIVEGIARGCRAHEMALAGGRPPRCRACITRHL